MSDFDSLYQRSLYFSPDQQDLLLAALSSNDPPSKGQNDASLSPQTAKPQNYNSLNQSRNGSSGPELFDSPPEDIPGSGRLSFGADDSPYLDLGLDGEFDFTGGDNMIGELPDGLADDFEQGEKRKSLDGREDDEESGKKRRESGDKMSKKPGRKPLTSEPTTKRKAQNRAAQRAFRDRKEKHLKDLETKVEGLEKVSQATNHENSMLKAQVGKLQVELKEYRKRLSWVSSGNSISPSSNSVARNGSSQDPRFSNEFSFEFPKFGDIPSAPVFNNNSLPQSQAPAKDSRTPPSATGSQYTTPGVVNRDIQNGNHNNMAPSSQVTNIQGHNDPANIAGFSRQNGYGHSMPGVGNKKKSSHSPRDHGIYPYNPRAYENPGLTFSDSPSASSDSQHGHISSICTSPEPTTNSPSTGKNESVSNMANHVNVQQSTPEGQKAFYDRLGEACGCPENPIPAAMAKPTDQAHGSVAIAGPDSKNTDNVTNDNNNQSTDDLFGFDWLAQQNGGHFDPVLFGDYRDPQDAVLSQEFDGFFNDVFPLPDIGNPTDNFDINPPAPKTDLVSQIDQTVNAADKEEVVPGDDRSQMLSCTKIWDRLQTMEKFRSGEIDVDNLCSELRTKARCSEGGVVVDQKDVENIMTHAI